jgi:hypothetical protein
MSLKQKTDAWLRIKKKKRNGVKSRKGDFLVDGVSLLLYTPLVASGPLIHITADMK